MATKKTDSKANGQAGSGAAKGGGARKGGSASKVTSAETSAPAAKSTSAEKGIAAKQARSTAAAGGSSSSGGAKRVGGAGKPDLRGDVRGFVSGRPQGWNHEEWLGFLEDLRQRGHNVEDRDSIGSMLERERLAQVLQKVPGIGAQRVQAIAERFGNLWRLKDAGPEQLAREANIPRPLAERIVDSVR